MYSLNPPRFLMSLLNKNLSKGFYEAEAFARLISLAISRNTYFETVNNSEMPNSDTLHLRITGNMSEMRKSFLPKAKIKEKGTLILDLTHEPFYGKRKNEFIHDKKEEKGSTGSYWFIDCFFLAKEAKMFLDSIIVKVFNSLEVLTDSILERVLKRIKTECVLLDRGFFSSEVIKVLEKSGVKYLVLVPKNYVVKDLIEKTKSFGVYRHTLSSGVKVTFVVIKDGKFDWVFCTNLKFSKAYKYIEEYKKRWNIETGFRVTDEAIIKTKSKLPAIRYFLHLISLVFYNLWKLSANLSKESISFKRFVLSYENLVTKAKSFSPPNALLILVVEKKRFSPYSLLFLFCFIQKKKVLRSDFESQKSSFYNFD